MSKGSKRKSAKQSKDAARSQPPASTSATVRRAPSASSTQTAPASSQRSAQAATANADHSTFAMPEQERARFALERIQALRDEWQDKLKQQKEFNSHASAMPFMIRANGLGQTAAFYRGKTDKLAYQRLYQLLSNWLTQPERPFAGHSDLLEAITQSNQDAYLVAQIEALLFLDWVKKLSSAFLAREEDQAPATVATEAKP